MLRGAAQEPCGVNMKMRFKVQGPEKPFFIIRRAQMGMRISSKISFKGSGIGVGKKYFHALWCPLWAGGLPLAYCLVPIACIFYFRAKERIVFTKYYESILF